MVILDHYKGFFFKRINELEGEIKRLESVILEKGMELDAGDYLYKETPLQCKLRMSKDNLKIASYLYSVN